jgi:probable HAF family extracellular repeat protein
MGGIGRKIGIMFLAVALVTLSCGSALAVDYTITDLGAMLSSTGASINGTDVWGSSINNNGVVVGQARFSGDTSSGHATLWQNGVAYDLGSLHDASRATYITDSGLIVGEAYADPSINNMYRQATVFSLGSSPVNIHSTMTYNANNSVATGAGNGYIVGQAYNDTVTVNHAVLWSNNGTTAVDMNPTGYVSSASALRGINSSGQMIGYSVPTDIGYTRPTLWNPNNDGTYDPSKATYLDLSADPKYSGLIWSAHSGYANDINDAGQAAVWFTNGIAGIWENDGSFTQINNLPGQFDHLKLDAINNSGQVVGSAYYVDWANGASNVNHAVLYDNGNLIDLGALFEGTGWYLTSAIDINDKGQILVQANRNGFDSRGLMDTLILTPGAGIAPVPIPAALPLFASGLAALGIFRRRFVRA